MHPLLVVGGFALLSKRSPGYRQGQRLAPAQVGAFWDFGKKSADQMLAALSNASKAQYALFCAAHVLKFFEAKYPDSPEVRKALDMGRDIAQGKIFSQTQITAAQKTLRRLHESMPDGYDTPWKFSAKMAVLAVIYALDSALSSTAEYLDDVLRVSALAAKGSHAMSPKGKAELEAEKKWQETALRSIYDAQGSSAPKAKAAPAAPIKQFPADAAAIFTQLSDKWKMRFSVFAAMHVLPNYAKAFPDSKRVANALKYAKDSAYGIPATDQEFNLDEAIAAAVKMKKPSAQMAILATSYALKEARSGQPCCAADVAYAAEISAGDAVHSKDAAAARAAERGYQLALLKKFLAYQKSERGGRVNTGQQAAYDEAMENVEATLRAKMVNEKKIQEVLEKSKAAVKQIADYVSSTETYRVLTDPGVLTAIATPAKAGSVIPEWVGWGLIGASVVVAAIVVGPEIFLGGAIEEGGAALIEIATEAGVEEIVIDEEAFEAVKLAEFEALIAERQLARAAAYAAKMDGDLAALKAVIRAADLRVSKVLAEQVLHVVLGG